MCGDRGPVGASPIRPRGISGLPAWLPQLPAHYGRRQTKRDHGWSVVVDPAAKGIPGEMRAVFVRDAHIQVWPESGHGLHAPRPPVVAPVVLRAVELPGQRMMG